MSCISRASAEGFREDGQEHQCDHHRQVFYDQPANGNATVGALDSVALLQCPEQDYGARNRKR